MKQFHNILFVSDGISDETAVLQQAIKLTEKNKATLTVLIMCPSFPEKLKNHKKIYEDSLIEKMEKSIKKIKSDLNFSKKKFEINVDLELDETPGIRIIQKVLRNSHDLLIKKIEKDTDKKGFHALDMQLLRKCPCALFLHRSSEQDYDKPHVAVAIDPIIKEKADHDLAIELLTTSQSLSGFYEGQLNIFSCWQVPFEGTILGNPWLDISSKELDSVIAEEKDQHKKALQKLINESGITDHYQMHLLKGQPQDLIPEKTNNKKINILVMGTVGRTGISGFIIGNTAESILQKISCSLLALKPPGFISPVKAY